MPRKYQPKFILGMPNPLYIPQTNRHKKAGEEGYKKHSGGKSKHMSLFKRGAFLAWDGEGFDINGKHVYGLLMNSEGDSIQNVKGLSTLECLTFISEAELRHKNAIHVCYGASYDVNMILRDVPRKDLVTLYKGDKIIFDRYELEYRPRKSFIIRRMAVNVEDRWKEKRDKDGKVNYEKVFEAKLTLWDVLGFFQGKFVKALIKNNIPCNLEAIEAGKKKRGAFTPEEMENFIKPYCLMEVEALVLLMQKLHDSLQEAGLVITRWDGAGACASALLKREGIKGHMAECPIPVQRAAQHAYSGGRIEPIQYGHYEGPVYHYDINSAYPYAMTFLPSLANGMWCHYTRDKACGTLTEWMKACPYSFSQWKISWKFPENMPLYPFSYRTLGGSILFPPHGKNWVHYPEIKAAFDTIPNIDQYISVEEVWAFKPSTGDKPFAFLVALFALRAALKKADNGAEKVLKLAINSLYGKMVQQLGYMVKDGAGTLKKKPPYHQLEWGGYVTSFTRAQLFAACMQDPNAIISLATDGIYSMRPLKNLDCGSGLGQWEYHMHEDMTIVTSGVYWYTHNGEEKSFYRGFDAGSLNRRDILDSWSLGKFEVKAPSTRFITLGAALLPNGGKKAQEERFRQWRSWVTIDRSLSLDMINVVKRLEKDDYDQKGTHGVWSMFGGTPDQQLYRTRARTIRFLRDEKLPFQDTYRIEGVEVNILSSPYKLKWEGGTEIENTIDGVPSFEYEKQHLDTFV